MLRISRTFTQRLPKATAVRAYSSRPLRTVAVAQKVSNDILCACAYNY